MHRAPWTNTSISAGQSRADGRDVPAAQLPGQYHPRPDPAPPRGRRRPEVCRLIWVLAWRGRSGAISRASRHTPQVLDEDSVHPHVRRPSADSLRRRRAAPGPSPGCSGSDRPSRPAGGSRPRPPANSSSVKFLALRRALKPTEAHIHRVGPILHGGYHGLPASGGAQQLGHWPRPCWALNS